MCKDFDAELMEMFRDVYNRRTNRVSRSFPRELFIEILESITRLSELNTNEKIQCDVNLSYGLCKVVFTYHEHIPSHGLYVEKIRSEYL